MALRGLLAARHEGRARAATGRALLAELEGLGFRGIHLRRIGEAVSALAAAGHPVAGTSGRGYFWVASEADRRAGRAEVVKRLRALSRRARAFDALLARRVQLALDLGDAP